MKKSFSIPILLFAALILVTYLLLPQYQEFKAIVSEKEQKEAELLGTEKYFSNLGQISENLRNYQDSLEKIESALPQDLSLSSLLSFFQKKSSENGLLLKNISQAKMESKEKRKEEKGILAPVLETHFNLNLSGSLLSLKGFLETLEKSSRLIEVENISVEVTKEELPEYNLLIKVMSFVQN